MEQASTSSLSSLTHVLFELLHNAEKRAQLESLKKSYPELQRVDAYELEKAAQKQTSQIKATLTLQSQRKEVATQETVLENYLRSDYFLNARDLPCSQTQKSIGRAFDQYLAQNAQSSSNLSSSLQAKAVKLLLPLEDEELVPHLLLQLKELIADFNPSVFERHSERGPGIEIHFHYLPQTDSEIQPLLLLLAQRWEVQSA